jgi:GT2 family glycosyltransferase
VAKASVIVVCHRAGPWLRPCLESVAVADNEVILVDNASPDSAASKVGASVGAKVWRSEVNLGFAGGVNQGLRLARAEMVALLNDDAVADSGWLPSAAKTLEDASVAAVGPKLVLAPTFATVMFDDSAWPHPRDPRRLGRQITSAEVAGVDVLEDLTGGVYEVEYGPPGPPRWRWTRLHDPLHLPLPPGTAGSDVLINGEPVDVLRTGDVINNAGSYLSSEGYGGDYGYETEDDGRFDRRAERFAVTGAAMAARRETFERLGGMAPGFFAYYEDLDWSWRARLAGFRIVYEPAGVVRHVRSATSSKVDSKFIEMLTRRNRLLCLARNAPLGFARKQTVRALRQPDRVGWRRSFARQAPVQLLRRARARTTWRVRPELVLTEWAGRDETWGLPSQLLDRYDTGGAMPSR